MTNKKLNKKHIQKQDSTFDVVNKRFPTNAAQDIYLNVFIDWSENDEETLRFVLLNAPNYNQNYKEDNILRHSH